MNAAEVLALKIEAKKRGGLRKAGANRNAEAIEQMPGGRQHLVAYWAKAEPWRRYAARAFVL